MSNAFDKVIAGLEDTQAYLHGERDGYRASPAYQASAAIECEK